MVTAAKPGAVMTRQLGWAALCAAGTLAFAAPAGATIVDVAISAGFYQLQGPAGFYPAQPRCDLLGISQRYCTFTADGREALVFYEGGIPFTVDFAFDTDLGVLTTTATGQTLSWDSSLGTPSPLLSGAFQFGQTNVPLLIDLDLSSATHVEIQRNELGFFFNISTPDYVLSQAFQSPIALAAPRLDTPGSGTCVCSPISYQDADYTTRFSELLSESITPRPIPEPSTWAMLILGFASIGASLRRRRLSAA
jgi:hypothetical protein